MDDLNEALNKSEKEGGTLQPVTDENGNVIGYCCVSQSVFHIPTPRFTASFNVPDHRKRVREIPCEIVEPEQEEEQ